MAATETPRQCPDCKTDLKPVALSSNTDVLPLGVQPGLELLLGDIRYCEPDSTKPLFSERPFLGRIAWFLCPTCQRILMYGVPRPPYIKYHD